MSRDRLFVAENFPPDLGGIETFNRRILEELARRGEGGTLLVPEAGRAWIEREAPSIGAVFSIVPSHGRLLDAALERVRSDSPRAVVVLRSSKRLRGLLRACRRRRIPSAVYVHGRTRTLERWPPRFWWWWRYRLDLADEVLTNSEYMARSLVSVGHRRERISVVPPGTDLDRLRPDPERRRRVRDEAGIGDAPVLVTVSRLVGGKGHDELLAALPVLRASFPTLRWWIVGDGPRRDGLERAIDASGLGDQIRIWGALPDPRDPLAAADLFVLPARNEAFGLAVLEAQAMGIPAVVLAGSGPEEIVDDGTTGVVTPSSEPAPLAGAIETLLRDSGLRERCGAAARRRAERFSWDSAVEGVLARLAALESGVPRS